MQCTINSTLCTRCNVVSGSPYLYLSTCIGVCPNGTYADTLYQCRSCQSPCLQCYSATNCSSCVASYSLYAPSGQCVVTCIGNTISVGSVCQQCQSPCLTCSSTISTCTSCLSGYALLSNNSCTNSCLLPAVSYMGYCSTCTYPCLTCDNTNKSICLTCATDYLLFSSSCYSSCPTHTYNDSATTCASCTPPCS